MINRRSMLKLLGLASLAAPAFAAASPQTEASAFVMPPMKSTLVITNGKEELVICARQACAGIDVEMGGQTETLLIVGEYRIYRPFTATDRVKVKCWGRDDHGEKRGVPFAWSFRESTTHA